MIGYHHHRLVDPSQPFQFHDGSDGSQRLSQTHFMRQQDTALLQNTPDSIQLVRTHRDLSVHAGQGQVRAIEMRASIDVVETVIQLSEMLCSFRVFPEPDFKGSFDLFQLRLRCYRGVLVHHLAVIDFVIDDRSLGVQAVGNQVKSTAPLRAPLRIEQVIRHSPIECLDPPHAQIRHIVNRLDADTFQQVFEEGLDHIGGNPTRAESGPDFTR